MNVNRTPKTLAPHLAAEVALIKTTFDYIKLRNAHRTPERIEEDENRIREERAAIDREMDKINEDNKKLK